MTEVSFDQVLQQHAYLEEGFALAIRRAGQGCDHTLERRLLSQARTLLAMLDGQPAATAVNDATNAARRVMEAADPEAPLRMLAMARENLRRCVRRQALRQPPRFAA